MKVTAETQKHPFEAASALSWLGTSVEQIMNNYKTMQSTNTERLP